MSRPPASFGDYLAFLKASLEENKRRGGVAVKFEAAYFRSLSFGDPGDEVVEPIYRKYRAGGVPTADEYTLFQDFIFRRIIILAADLRLPVHIHTSVGGGDYFSLRNGDVLNLEHVVRDPRHRLTTFVLIHGAWHGGWVWQRVAPALREAGHDVHAPTLTGLSDRAHLLHPGVGLGTHVTASQSGARSRRPCASR